MFIEQSGFVFAGGWGVLFYWILDFCEKIVDSWGSLLNCFWEGGMDGRAFTFVEYLILGS